MSSARQSPQIPKVGRRLRRLAAKELLQDADAPRVISITSGSLRIRLGARDIRKAAAYMVAVGLLFGSVDQAAVQAGKAVEDTSALIEQIQALDDSDTGARKSKQRLQGGSLDGDIQLDSVAATSTSLDDLIREAAEAEEPASRDSEA
jgi:hypothetical protein